MKVERALQATLLLRANMCPEAASIAIRPLGSEGDFLAIAPLSPDDMKGFLQN